MGLYSFKPDIDHIFNDMRLSLFAFYRYQSTLPINEFQTQIAANADKAMLNS